MSDTGVAARKSAVFLLDEILGEGKLMPELLGAGVLDKLPADDRARAQRLAQDTLRGMERADRILQKHLTKYPPLTVRNALRVDRGVSFEHARQRLEGEAADGDGPHEGLALARRIAQLHYRADASLEQRFGRAEADRFDQIGLWNRFQVESYLDYHGMKLVRRFDANSYLVLNKAMDLHDVGRGRGGRRAALGRVNCPVMVVSIDSDILYTPRQQRELRDDLEAIGDVAVTFEEITSVHGHDGFLIEFDQLGPMIERFVTDQFKAGRS